MAKYAALEWDEQEARIAVARTRGSGVLLEHAVAIPLREESDEVSASGESIARQIEPVVARLGISKLDTLVAVGRSDIELRWLSLPPAPEEELPDMVRMQARRQFSTLGDEWPLDFLPLENQGDETQQVLAAAISPDVIKNIQETCATAELKPQRIALRACAAATLVRSDSDEPRLLVDLSADSADLTVLIASSVVFLRTVRLPKSTDEAVQIKSLLGEVRRTLAAAHNQLGDRRVEHAVLFGKAEDFRALEADLQNQLSLKTVIHNPFDDVALGGVLRAELPSHAGRFAPLIGMLVDQLHDRRPAIDFLDPRRRPEPPNRRRQYVIAGAAALLLVAVAVGFGWTKLNAKNRRIAELQAESLRLDELVKTAKERQRELEEIENWARGEVNWLEELKMLSQRMPSAKQTMLRQASLSSENKGGGRITLDGYADDSKTMQVVEDALADGSHNVPRMDHSKTDEYDKYPLSFDGTIVIKEEILKPEDVEKGSDEDEPLEVANEKPDAESSTLR